MKLIRKNEKFDYKRMIIKQFKNYVNINNKIKNKSIIDPIEIIIDNKNKIYLYDGIHRYIMYRKNNYTNIPVIISRCVELDNKLKNYNLIPIDKTRDTVINAKAVLPKSTYNLVYIDKHGIIHSINNKNAPFRVIYRSRDWVKFYKKIPYKPYQNIFHPDLIKKNGHRNDSRIKLIETKVDIILPDKNKKYVGLDVGCSYGMFSRYFSKKGVKMTSLEWDKNVIYCSKYLNKYFNTNINYENVNVINWVEKNKHRKYDIIVCLSIIHNIMQIGQKKKALEILRNLSKMGKCMLFDIGEENEKGDQVSKLNMNLKKGNILNFIHANTVYTKAFLLGKESGYCNRSIYLLTK